MGKDLKGKELGKGITQRSDGRYRARVIIDGKTVDKYSFDLKALKIEVARLQKETSKKKAKPKVIDQKMPTLSQIVDEFFEVYKAPFMKNDGSINAYKTKINNTYKHIIGDKRIAELEHKAIQMATNELAKKYSPKYLREAFNIYRQAVDIAILNDKASANPFTQINFPKEEKKEERRVMDEDELKVFIAMAQDSFYFEVYMVMLLTGMRIGEIGALQWEDIDFTKKCINVRGSLEVAYFEGTKTEQIGAPKTLNSYRSIPFFDDVETHLLAWKKKQAERKQVLGNRWRCPSYLKNPVFTTSYGSSLNRYNICHDLEPLEERIRAKLPNFEHIYPHSFRHTFVTRCLEKGLEPIFVQKICGHANYSTTVSYSHITSEKKNVEIKKTVDFLPALLSDTKRVKEGKVG